MYTLRMAARNYGAERKSSVLIRGHGKRAALPTKMALAIDLK